MDDHAMATDNTKTDINQDKATYVWDVPTRLFHWGLVGAVATSLVAGEFGYMDIHVMSGHVVLALILFRLAWGFFGGKHARFSDFVKGPGTVLAYARKLISGNAPAHSGHNPMGALSVIAVLVVLIVQVSTGLFANDDILTEGPLASEVSKSTSDYLTYIHYRSGYVLYGLIGLHLAAVLFYTFKGHPIVVAMISGKMRGLPENPVTDSPSSQNKLRGSWIAAIIFAGIASAIAYGILTY